LIDPFEEWRDLNPLLFYPLAHVGQSPQMMAYLLERCSMMMSTCHLVYRYAVVGGGGRRGG
jgi:hypothetical protein